jgi:xanthine dioxygenase
MTIQVNPLNLPPSADPSKFSHFGREVIGVNPGNLSPAEFSEIEQLLYKVLSNSGIFLGLIFMQYDALLFRNASLSPEQQYAFTKVIQYSFASLPFLVRTSGI